MENIRKVGDFIIKVDIHGIRLNNLLFSPAEIAKVTGLIGWAHRMSRLKALPPTIGDPPFQIYFQESGGLLLVREKADDKTAVNFSFKDADSLVIALKEAINTHVDITTLGGIKRVGSVPDLLPDQDLV